MIVQISDHVLPTADIVGMLAVMNRGGEFDTVNGEYTDAMARTVAQWWAITDVEPIVALANGSAVDHDELRDSISGIGRAFNWPASLEYLATWLMNRGI